MVCCFICDRTLEPCDAGVFSVEEVAKTVQKLFGDLVVLVIGSKDKLCRKCCDLVSRISRLEGELMTANLALRALLRLKYSLDFTGQPKLPQLPPLFLELGVKSHSDLGNITENVNSTNKIKELRKPVMKHKASQTLKLSSDQHRHFCQPLDSKSTLQHLDPSKSTNVPPTRKRSADESLSTVLSTGKNAIPMIAGETTSLGVNQLEEASKSDNTCNHSEKLVCFLDETEVSEKEIDVDTVHGGNRSSNSETVSKRVFSCGACPFRSNSFKTIKAHFISFNRKDGYYCSLCDFGFHQRNHLKTHMDYHSEKSRNICCAYCKILIHDRLQLKYHYKLIHNKSGLYVCSLCNKVYRFCTELQYHQARVHKKMKAFCCEKCDAIFNDETKLVRHEYAHRESLSCLHCGKTFKSIGKLSSHEYHVHKHYKLEKYECRFCPRLFSKKDYLPEHEKQHTEHFEFRCDICNYGYHEKALLEAHRERHKLFKTQQLKRPREVRRGVHPPRHRRSWMCEVCGKLILKYQNYKLHRELHENSVSFQCPSCSKMFRYKNSMNKHVRRFHPAVEVGCKIKNTDSEEKQESGLAGEEM